MNDGRPRAVTGEVPRMHHVQSGSYTRLNTPGRQGEDCRRFAWAGAPWTLLPQSEWPTELVPVYRNAYGCICEGDPYSDPAEDVPNIIPCCERDPVTGEEEWFEAIENEIVIEFCPGVTPPRIREIMSRFGLRILHASVGSAGGVDHGGAYWIHGEATADSEYLGRTSCLIHELSCAPEVGAAGYNEIAELCTDDVPLVPIGEDMNDPLWRTDGTGGGHSSTTISKLGLFAAWTDPAAQLGRVDNAEICTVVMDTGIDVDHEDFRFPDPESPGEFRTRIFELNAARQGVCATKDAVFCGPMDPWQQEPEPGSTDPAPNAPTGADPDPLKFINLHWVGHGHGTYMAGVIGAAVNNGVGVVSCTTNRVRIMSATLRMGGNQHVSIASAVRCVEYLTRHFSPTSAAPVRNVRVVFMGFAVERTKRGPVWRQLLSAMRDDVAKQVEIADEQRPRLWVAPAQNRGTGSKLSYPAALLWELERQRSRRRLVRSTLTNLPEILGVTGLTGRNAADEKSNFLFRGPFDPDGESLTGPGAAEVYSISSFTSYGSHTLDVRDRWYGTQYRDESGNLQSAPLDSGGLGPTAGYKHDSGYALDSSATVAAPRRLPFGNSLAAAQIAALAALLFSRRPGRSPAELVRLMRENPITDPGHVVLQIGERSLRFVIRDGAEQENGLLPALVDFHQTLRVNASERSASRPIRRRR